MPSTKGGAASAHSTRRRTMTTTYSAISFQGIAGNYNAINGLPATEASQIGAAVAALVSTPAKIVDVGCGAGRLTVPIAAANGHAVGVDLAEAMLREMCRTAHEQHVAVTAASALGEQTGQMGNGNLEMKWDMK